ncbi:MAG: LysM peptidoglycan-binding domain-containing protein [Anaerolineae bacterium]|nr:LysM peptidoglycan-binding domain-containing protein [Anaerolineae bacterium]MDW8068996.1 LysM peptidoglycan-binding domain-containing protein [Anaerolineae bacterium]
MNRRMLLILLTVLLAGCSPAPSMPTPTPTEASPTVPLAVAPLITPAESTPTASPPQAYPPSLYLDPASVSLEVGETVAIRVWGDGMGGIHLLSMELTFDPVLVQIEDADPVAEGAQITPGNLMGTVEENRVEPGRVRYRTSVLPGEIPKEGGLVCSFVLRGMAAGVTPLRFEHIMAQDANRNPMDVLALSDGLITIGGGEALPPPEEPPLPAPTSTSPPSPADQPTPLPTGAGGIYYVVYPGETLYRIGRKFGTTAEAIAAANHISDPREVPAGTMLLIPVPAPGGGYGYYVRPRDTVYSIARRFGMTVEELVTLNGIGPDYLIHPDTILKVVPR